MSADDYSGLLDQYLELLHLLAEVRSRFPSENSPEVSVVTKQLKRLETQIRCQSDRHRLTRIHSDDFEFGRELTPGEAFGQPTTPCATVGTAECVLSDLPP